MKNRLDIKNKAIAPKKSGRKISLNLHIMPQKRESTDVRVFSWLTGGLLILISLIIFLMIYV